ncbi:hypothetical protein QDT13_000691 [Acinetobacter baumannii]|uniref:hypothetical protein n=2 Tax=Acinetobacter baumannii TaxID=470 RepID=UPI0002BB80A1|nr:hypothetical protein [Acinetobacter baumannii]HBX4478758.1 hypothetical protein [Klebsiella pneumoniae]AKQ29911.1 hypothetical protein ACX61_05740 [Acinetobacter baumannii]EKV3804872.1 hypothetical protein [Acinetobacter baumannii]EKW1171329.1 hypothetical protein [Acinetobacter baumannii]KMV09465.1 hypothetical protein AB988_4295 [Acinetobacter baumannii]
MDKCREEFEQSPKTKELLSDSIYFDEKENRYKVNADGCLISVVFLNGRWEVWQEQQAKVEELQALYTQQGINMLKMQKRVDAALKLIESWNEIAFDKTTHWTEGYEEGCYHCAAQLEQALKGEGQ